MKIGVYSTLSSEGSQLNRAGRIVSLRCQWPA